MSIVSYLWALRVGRSWHSFEEMTKHPEDAQRRLLRQIIADNSDTAFGREHGFANITTLQDYRKAVPIADYEVFRPWIDRMHKGERFVLTADDPYMFTMTSGTTGQPKLIPVNRSTAFSTMRLSALWLYRCLKDHPAALDHKALVVVSPAVEGCTPGGIPIGSASGYIYQHASSAIRRVYAVPYPVFTIKDFEAKYYTIMRFAVERRVSFLATPNPSTILRLVTTADGRKDQLIRDIGDGTVTKEINIPPDIRREIERVLKPNPKRAEELQKAAAAVGSFRPAEYWPELSVVGCWKGGSVGATVERLRPWFRPETAFRDIGYLSSEAQVTLPIQDKGASGILALHTNFYEFIPEAEMVTERPQVLTADKLESGENYYIFITSPIGLYRYDINDVVKVTGFFHRTPVIEFVRKGRDMVSLTGEKLHVGQLVQAIEAAQRSVGIRIEYYRAVGDPKAPRYDLRLEVAEYPVRDELVVRLGQAIDSELGKLNIEYDQKRRSGRLLPPRVQLMARGWSVRRVQAKLARGGRDTQFKDRLLALSDPEDNPAEVLKEIHL